MLSMLKMFSHCMYFVQLEYNNNYTVHIVEDSKERKNEGEWIGKVEIRTFEKERFLFEDEADMDIIILTYLIQTLNEITFINSAGFSTLVALIFEESDINSTDRRK